MVDELTITQNFGESVGGIAKKILKKNTADIIVLDLTNFPQNDRSRLIS